MKKLMLFLLAISLLVSCSKSENGINEDNPDALVPITLGSEVASKAPIVSPNTFDAGIAGWEHDTPTYTAAPTWSTNVSTTAVAPGGTAASVTWTDQKYYNADGTKTFIKAWYPEGALATSSVTFANTDGSVDAMLAPVINGNKTNKTNKELAFKHKTTQLTFTVKAGASFDAGTTITSIKINGAELPTGFNLGTDAVIYTAAANGGLTVPDINNNAIETSATVVGNAVMIKPIAGNKITLDIITNKASYTAQEVTVATSNVDEGTHYVIALNFGQASVELTANVKTWIPSTGSGTIE